MLWSQVVTNKHTCPSKLKTSRGTIFVAGGSKLNLLKTFRACTGILRLEEVCEYTCETAWKSCDELFIDLSASCCAQKLVKGQPAVLAPLEGRHQSTSKHEKCAKKKKSIMYVYMLGDKEISSRKVQLRCSVHYVLGAVLSFKFRPALNPLCLNWVKKKLKKTKEYYISSLLTTFSDSWLWMFWLKTKCWTSEQRAQPFHARALKLCCKKKKREGKPVFSLAIQSLHLKNFPSISDKTVWISKSYFKTKKMWLENIP